ncbi:MAG: response regulator [Planctomycetota bacterium]|nr:response regulator [Planctomycetota bacterium]
MALGKILVIDDDRVLLEIVGDMVRRAGFQAQVTDNPMSGMEAAKKDNVSLVLLDVMMPEMDGFEVLKALKEDEGTSAIPVIMLTSQDEIKSFAEAHDLGAVDYIPKPFEENFLIKRIYRALFRK